MSTPSTTTQASGPADKPYCPIEWAKAKLQPYLAPYYLVLFGVLGAITGVFVAITVVLILVVSQFNVLSLIE